MNTVSTPTGTLFQRTQSLVATLRDKDYDLNELRKALSYLNAHLDDPDGFLEYLDKLADHGQAHARGQSLTYWDIQRKAVKHVAKDLTGRELALVIGRAYWLLKYHEKMKSLANPGGAARRFAAPKT